MDRLPGTQYRIVKVYVTPSRLKIVAVRNSVNAMLAHIDIILRLRMPPYSSSSIELASGPKKGTSYRSSVAASKYALQVNHPIPAKSPMNSTQEMKLDQLNMMCTTKTKANSKLLCHAWNRT